MERLSIENTVTLPARNGRMLILTGIRNWEFLFGKGSYCPTFPFCSVGLVANFCLVQPLKEGLGLKVSNIQGQSTVYKLQLLQCVQSFLQVLFGTQQRYNSGDEVALGLQPSTCLWVHVCTTWPSMQGHEVSPGFSAIVPNTSL